MINEKQAQYDELHKEYMVALYASPRDEGICLALAERLLEIVKGTNLEERQINVVERHLRKLNKA